MTREDLAKDILIAFIPQWTDILGNMASTDNPVKVVSKHAVDLADALLEALAAKEAPDYWSLKAVQTAVKPGCLPVLEPGATWKPGLWDTVKWKGAQGAQRTFSVECVNAGPTQSWTIIKECGGESRSHVVKDVFDLSPCVLEEDEG